jgi:DNA polymerase III subunit gamma/tau
VAARLQAPVAGSAQSLYRKHRPRTFADVVGQEAVVQTLSNAVQRGQVHHAYLFVGSRGTGKTSTAKILAACLNCEQGPTIAPCGACDSCRSIAAATSLDVIEMDAASNNSVEDIRELRESVVFAPVSGRHKVYILDEAHMLSQAAWNAFLKTLEEPPAGTVFVLATTEASKVPATVVDRCHRFDFQRPTVEQISSVLARVARTESIEIPQEALAAIARSATGSFRDGLGTLEQLVTYSGKRVALVDVLAVLGIADEQLLEDAFEAVRAGDARAALHAVARCTEQGRDAGSFIRDLEGRARELLVVGTLGEVPSELSLTAEIDERLLAQSERMSAGDVVRTLDLLGRALEAVRAGADPRTQLELALVKAAAPQADGSTRALLARIERLEQSLVAQTRKPDSGPRPAPEAQEASPAGSPEAQEASPAGSPDPSASLPTAAVVDPASDAEESPQEALAASVTEEVVVDLAPQGAVDLASLWPAVLESVKAEHALLGACFAEAFLGGASEEELTLVFPQHAAFNKRKAEEAGNRAVLADTLQRLIGRRYRLNFELGDPTIVQPSSQVLSEEEIVERLKREFDAEELPEDWIAQQEGGE